MMSRTAQKARMNEYAKREMLDREWNGHVDTALAKLAEVDATCRDLHAQHMASLDACIAAFEEMGK